MIPDITFELAKKNEPMYLFSPYDVERVYGVPFADVNVTEKYYEMVDDKRIRKTKISAREFFQTLAEIQFESGYPYVMFEDTVNRANPIKGKITHSNLCSEILQVSTPSTFNEDLSYEHVGGDISCNLGSMNIASDGLGDLGTGREHPRLTAVRTRRHRSVPRSKGTTVPPSASNEPARVPRPSGSTTGRGGLDHQHLLLRCCSALEVM